MCGPGNIPVAGTPNHGRLCARRSDGTVGAMPPGVEPPPARCFLWYVPIAPGATALTLPALPSGLDPDAVFGEARSSVIVAVQHCERRPELAPCSRWATSRFFGVRP